MEFFKPNTNIDFLSIRYWAASLSVLMFVASISSLVTFGLKWGLDFTGGTQIVVSYPTSADMDSIRDNLQNADFDDAVVQTYGTSRDVLISIAPREDLNQSE